MRARGRESGDVASGWVRRRRTAIAVTAAAAVVLVIAITVALGQGDERPLPAPDTATPPTSGASQPETYRWVDGPKARPQAVVVDPDDTDRRAAQWWSCRPCGSPKGALVLTEDAFSTRTIVRTDADTGLAWAGDEHVALVDWNAGTTELIGFNGSRRPVRLGSTSPAPVDRSVISATVDGIWQPVWIEVSAAVAHPVPLPAEASGASDDSVWRDANGLVWFGSFEDNNMVATSRDGGASWTTHRLGSGHMLPTYSGAKDVLAVLGYEDVNRSRLRFLWAWYSVDGGATWARTDADSGPAAPIENQGGMVRADGRLVMHAPGNAGLIVMEDGWTRFAPAAWTPGAGGEFELLGMQGWGDSLTVIGRPANSAEVYISASPGDDWTPLQVR